MPAVQPILNRLFVIVALCTWISGCASLTSEHGMLWLDGQPRADLPDRILPVWADAVLHQPGKSAVRGFGGRLYFMPLVAQAGMNEFEKELRTEEERRRRAGSALLTHVR